jgi:hypothetical protein
MSPPELRRLCTPLLNTNELTPPPPLLLLSEVASVSRMLMVGAAKPVPKNCTGSLVKEAASTPLTPTVTAQ